MRRAFGTFGVVALAASSPWLVARAQEPAPAPAPALVYSGPSSCPQEAEFTRRMNARLGVSNRTGDVHRTLGVLIVRSEGQYVGRFTLTGVDRHSTTKTVRGHDCSDVVDALSLVAALAVRSDESDAAAAAQATASTSAHSSPPEPPPSPPPKATPGGTADADSNSRFGLELGGLVAAGPAPLAIFGGTVGGGWASGSSLVSPAVGLAVAIGASPDVDARGGTASFAWFVLRMDVCALRFGLGRALFIRGCLLGDAGLLSARGSSTPSPASSSRGWLSLGASSRIEFPIGSRFGIHLLAGVEAPLRRDRYAFGSVDFFQPPAVIITGSASAAAYFR